MNTTASQIAAALTAWKQADDARMASRPAGMPRGAWRRDNPIPTPDFPRTVRDTKFKSRPVRHLTTIDSSLRLFVATKALRTVEVIDLREPDADQRLRRYQEA